MGGCSSTEEEKMSKQIDKTINESKEKIKKEIKVLLLGAGASGKTTIAKQMKILHLNGFSEPEKIKFKELVYYNIFTNIKALVRGADLLNIAIEQEHHDIAEELRTMTLQLESISLNGNKAKQIEKLWNSQSIQAAYNRSNEFQLEDGADYFFNKMAEVSQDNYIPSTGDILNVRVKTTGLKEIQFPCKGSIFRVVDVGGQRNERRKWIHCFQEVTTILFIVALNDYERLLEEDEKTNRMVEAINLFEQVVNNRWFQDTPTILFLNKRDLFDKRIKIVPISKFFPEYNGANDYEPCVEFFKQKFLSINKNQNRKLYSHQTCATDTQNIRVVWNAVKDIILDGVFGDSGF